MRIDKINVKPSENSICPEFLIEIDIKYFQYQEVPLELGGELYSEDNKKLGEIHEKIVVPPSINLLELQPRVEGYYENTNHEISYKLLGTIRLESRSLDYLEKYRLEKNPTREIILKFHISIKLLRCNMILSDVFDLKLENLKASLPDPFKESKFLLYKYNYHKDNSSGSKENNMFLLSANGFRSPILQLDITNSQLEFRISQSDWLNKYCPIFNLGKFLILEYPIFNESTPNTPLTQKIQESYDSLQKMSEKLLIGEWVEVIAYARPIAELFRNDANVEQNFISSGYTPEAAKNFNDCLKALFDLTSKFHHKLDRNRNIQATFIPSREDAYMIYSLCVGIINLIGKKC